jgi:DNA recombination protein RmuC
MALMINLSIVFISIIVTLLVFMRMREQAESLRNKNMLLIAENTQKTEMIASLENDLNTESQRALEALALQQTLGQDNAKLQATLKEKEKTFDFIKTSKIQINEDFKQIASAVLKQDSQNLGEKNADLLMPLTTQIKNFKEKIEGLSIEQGKDRAALKVQIELLSEAHKISLEGAEKLTNALTYDNKQQGDWGEMVLESILQGSGLNKGVEFDTQKNYQDEQGRRYKPDVIIHLPDDKDIVIDSKVSLTAYQNFVQSKDKSDLKAHIASIDKHIKDISLKGYENLHGINTLDYIFVFFPIEASLLVALEENPSLFDNAIKKNVALVSPSTLMMSLKIVHHIWQNEKQNKHTEEIARLAGNMYDKLVGFVGSLDDLDRQLKGASKSYDEARKRLNSGKGNVFSIAEKIKTLGVSSKKEIKL